MHTVRRMCPPTVHRRLQPVPNFDTFVAEVVNGVGTPTWFDDQENRLTIRLMNLVSTDPIGYLDPLRRAIKILRVFQRVQGKPASIRLEIDCFRVSYLDGIRNVLPSWWGYITQDFDREEVWLRISRRQYRPNEMLHNRATNLMENQFRQQAKAVTDNFMFMN